MAISERDIEIRYGQIDMNMDVLRRKKAYIEEELKSLQLEKEMMGQLLTIYKKKQEIVPENIVSPTSAPITRNVIPKEELQKYRDQPVSEERERELDSKINGIVNEINLDD